MQSLETKVKCGKPKLRKPPSSKAWRAVTPVLALAMLLMFANTANAQGTWMHLLAPGIGWLGNPYELFWTTDNGQHWKDITPAGVVRTPGYSSGSSIGSVFFLNTSTGWVVLNRAPEEASDAKVPKEAIIDLAYTQDSGATWSISHIHFAVKPQGYTLGGAGDIQFTDAKHGWISVGVQRAEASFLGELYRTEDGGKTWTWVCAGGTGRLRFIDQQNGWASSPRDGQLWATHDGAKTWNQIKLAPPAEVVGPRDALSYTLPVFSDKKHGVVVVSYGKYLPGNWAVLFTTADSGKSWTFNRVMTHGERAGAGDPLDDRIALVDSVIIRASPPEGNGRLTKIPLNVKGSAHVVPDDEEFSWASGLSFFSPNEGWALIYGTPSQLISTVDGGSTWADITP